MGSKSFTGKGATLSIGTGTGTPETFTLVAQCKTLQLNGQKWTFDEITNLDSPAPGSGPGVLEEIVPTKMSGGSMSIGGVFLPGDAGQLAMTTASINAELHNFKMQLPKGPNQTTTGNLYAFSAYVEDFPTPDVQVDKAITFKTNLRLTSPITVTPGS